MFHFLEKCSLPPSASSVKTVQIVQSEIVLNRKKKWPPWKGTGGKGGQQQQQQRAKVLRCNQWQKGISWGHPCQPVSDCSFALSIGSHWKGTKSHFSTFEYTAHFKPSA
jgi:hypothetical protein